MQPVEYAKLTHLQQDLFLTYQRTPQAKAWDVLDSSQVIEFAGATQALANWWSPKDPPPWPGLDTVEGVREIQGSNPSSIWSWNKYYLGVVWKNGAEEQFRNSQWGKWWHRHICLFHWGQHGYQQNKNGNPFLGIVVLFDKDKPTGQFHIGMRTLGHYLADNGNVAKNYRTYCLWYGELKGYNVTCPPLTNQSIFEEPLE